MISATDQKREGRSVHPIAHKHGRARVALLRLVKTPKRSLEARRACHLRLDVLGLNLGLLQANDVDCTFAARGLKNPRELLATVHGTHAVDVPTDDLHGGALAMAGGGRKQGWRPMVKIQRVTARVDVA